MSDKPRTNAMRKHALALGLAAAVAGSPSEARAGIISDIGDAIATIALVGVVIIGTVSTLTVVATVKNYRSSSRGEDPSAGWVGVGVVGGLAHAGVGSMLFLDGLPSADVEPCSSYEPADRERTADGKSCIYRKPASTGALVFGTLATGLGALSLTFAIKAAVTDAAPPGQAPTAQPGQAPAAVGLPLFRF